MADPIIEKLASAVKTILAGIKPANGYETTVTEVVRPTRIGGYRPRHMLVVLEQDDWRDAEGGHPANVVRRVLPMTASVYVRPAENDTNPVDYHLNRAEADIEKALMAAPTLSGQAQGILMTPPQSFSTPDGAFEARSVRFEITYRHSASNPYTAA